MEEPSPLDAEFDGLRDILAEEASWRRCAAELHEQQQEYIALLVELGGAAAPRRLLGEDVAEAVELGVEGRLSLIHI